MSACIADVDLDVFRKYAGVSLPRHVSYPMPTWWHPMAEDDARAMIHESDSADPMRGLSLYLHIPFCAALCKFCACTKMIQRHDATGASERTDGYVAALIDEIHRRAESISGERLLRQIHWGGGTPTYLSEGQITRIHQTVAACFSIADGAEISMEIDPRVTTPEMLAVMRDLGFNRISMGVQDFDEQVQRHVRRIQSFEMVKGTVATCRALGYDSVNFDLIYGMPYQTPETIRRTVEATIELSPDRIANYHYAQIPEKIATQRGMDYTKLPDSESKLEMFLIGLDLFTDAGYDFIGLDHFAKSDEGLAAAAGKGTLQRNFQGMTTGGGLDLIGVGVSAIGHLTGVGFLQNVKEVDRYIDCVRSGGSPIERGKRLTPEDYLRQTVISQLYCNAELQPEQIEAEFDIDFAQTFERELTILGELERDGLVTIDGSGVIRVTCPLGRVLLRNVAAVFDAYLDPMAYRDGVEACFSANA